MRALQLSDIPLFVAWEKKERPYPWTETNFKESQTFVWEEQGQAVGFGTIQLVDEEAYLINIMVDPAKRRHRHAEKIMKEIVDWAKSKKAAHMVLDVDPNNTPALNLYKKTGFQIIGERPNATPRGERAYVMRRSL